MFPPDPIDPSFHATRHFHTTHWSVILRAVEEPSKQSSQALEQLCQTYWHPLYAYVRRRGYSVEEAQDLTQEFFSRLLKNDYLSSADPERGRFRSFLLTSLKHMLANEWHRGRTQRRGGAQPHFSIDAAPAEQRFRLEPAESASPDELYDRRWAQTLLDRVVERLQREWEARPGIKQFDQLKVFLLGPRGAVPMAEMANRLGVPLTTLKSSVQRLRRLYREIFREEVAQTVAGPEEIDEEIRHLFAALGG